MFYTAIILGLLGSFHCVGMCGAIAFILPIDRNNTTKQTLQIISYHLGRLTSYSLIGLVFGLLGRGFELFGFQQHLSIFTGILMILFVLLPKAFQNLTFFKLTSRVIIKVKSALGKELKEKRNDTFFTLGFLNGYLPCGLVYMALLGAIASRNALTGSLYMFLFGLGTIPLMTSVMFAKNIINAILKKKIQQLIPIFILIMGFLFVLRGLDLDIPYISPSTAVSNLAENNKTCH